MLDATWIPAVGFAFLALMAFLAISMFQALDFSTNDSREELEDDTLMEERTEPVYRGECVRRIPKTTTPVPAEEPTPPITKRVDDDDDEEEEEAVVAPVIEVPRGLPGCEDVAGAPQDTQPERLLTPVKADHLAQDTIFEELRHTQDTDDSAVRRLWDAEEEEEPLGSDIARSTEPTGSSSESEGPGPSTHPIPSGVFTNNGGVPFASDVSSSESDAPFRQLKSPTRRTKKPKGTPTKPLRLVTAEHPAEEFTSDSQGPSSSHSEPSETDTSEDPTAIRRTGTPKKRPQQRRITTTTTTTTTATTTTAASAAGAAIASPTATKPTTTTPKSPCISTSLPRTPVKSPPQSTTPTRPSTPLRSPQAVPLAPTQMASPPPAAVLPVIPKSPQPSTPVAPSTPIQCPQPVTTTSPTPVALFSENSVQPTTPVTSPRQTPQATTTTTPRTPVKPTSPIPTPPVAVEDQATSPTPQTPSPTRVLTSEEDVKTVIPSSMTSSETAPATTTAHPLAAQTAPASTGGAVMLPAEAPRTPRRRQVPPPPPVLPTPTSTVDTTLPLPCTPPRVAKRAPVLPPGRSSDVLQSPTRVRSDTFQPQPSKQPAQGLNGVLFSPRRAPLERPVFVSPPRLPGSNRWSTSHLTRVTDLDVSSARSPVPAEATESPVTPQRRPGTNRWVTPTTSPTSPEVFYSPTQSPTPQTIFVSPPKLPGSNRWCSSHLVTYVPPRAAALPAAAAPVLPATGPPKRA